MSEGFRYVLVCAALVCAACNPRAQAEGDQPHPNGEARITAEQAQKAGVAFAPVAVDAVGREIAMAGRVTFDDRRVAHIFSPVTGRVTRLVAELGQRVKKGDALAIIASPDLATAVSDQRKAEADFNAARRDYHRMNDLYEAHAGSQRDAEAAQNAFERAQAELQRAREKVDLLHGGAAGAAGQDFVLRAPIDGEVIARSVNPGTEVQGQYSGGATAELYTIGALDSIWVLADAFEMDLARLATGQQVSVRVVSFPDRVFTGTVDWLSGAIDPATRTAKVRVVIDNRDGALKPEMYASVRVATRGREALTVPRDAVLRQGDQTVVLIRKEVTADGSLAFERRPVHVDDEGGDGPLVVLHGLEPGEQVVTSGGILLLGML